uniref:Uncharacterized protein n=1 Tax=Globodera rostochiensis TaxID=31243 RepID=A0A914GR77_GLORO
MTRFKASVISLGHSSLKWKASCCVHPNKFKQHPTVVFSYILRSTGSSKQDFERVDLICRRLITELGASSAASIPTSSSSTRRAFCCVHPNKFKQHPTVVFSYILRSTGSSKQDFERVDLICRRLITELGAPSAAFIPTSSSSTRRWCSATFFELILRVFSYILRSACSDERRTRLAEYNNQWWDIIDRLEKEARDAEELISTRASCS